jgi:hypothetical protein
MSNNITEETIVSLNETLLEEVELDAEGLENVRGGALTFARLGTTAIGQLRRPTGLANGDCTVQCTGNCIVKEALGNNGTGVFTRPNSLTGIQPGNLGGLAGGTLGGLLR